MSTEVADVALPPSLEQVRQRLSQLTQSLVSLRTRLAQAGPIVAEEAIDGPPQGGLPVWSQLSPSLSVLLSQAANLAAQLREQSKVWSQFHVVPAPGFVRPEETGQPLQAELVWQSLVRTRPLPEVEASVNEARLLGSLDGTNLDVAVRILIDAQRDSWTRGQLALDSDSATKLGGTDDLFGDGDSEGAGTEDRDGRIDVHGNGHAMTGTLGGAHDVGHDFGSEDGDEDISDSLTPAEWCAVRAQSCNTYKAAFESLRQQLEDFDSDDSDEEDDQNFEEKNALLKVTLPVSAPMDLADLLQLRQARESESEQSFAQGARPGLSYARQGK
ncbi:mediator of RNA polymerase II transcription subunit 8 [Savitreella phatthalungensis]